MTNCCCCPCIKVPCAKPPEEKPPEEKPPKPPLPEENCICKVAFTQIDIHDNGETSKGEWELDMTVNGVTKMWKKDGVLEKTYPLSTEFTIPCDTQLIIHVGGWELDPGGASGGFWDWIEDNNDPLGTVDAAYPSAESALGPHQRNSVGGDGSYTIYWNVVKTCEKTQSMSFSEFKSHLLRRGVHEGLIATDEQLLSTGVGFLQRKGWRLERVVGDKLYFKGFKPFLRRPLWKIEKEKKRKT